MFSERGVAPSSVWTARWNRALQATGCSARWRALRLYLQVGLALGAFWGLLGRLVVEILSREPLSLGAATQRVLASSAIGAGALACWLALSWLADTGLTRVLKSRRWQTATGALAMLLWCLSVPCAWIMKWTAGIFPSDALAGVMLEDPWQALQAGLDASWGLLSLVAAISLLLVGGSEFFLRHQLRRESSAQRRQSQLVLFFGLCLLGNSISVLWHSSGSTVLCAEMAWISSVTQQGSVAQLSEREEVNAFVEEYALPPVEPGGALDLSEGRWLDPSYLEQAPNLLVIMLESVPRSRMGYAGYEREVSPNIDRLAARSWNFTRTWSPSAQSNYAQPSALSSQLPIRSYRLDTYQNITYPVVFMHQFFRDLGYETGVISSQNEEWMGMKRFMLSSARPDTYVHSPDHPGPHIGVGSVANLADHVAADLIEAWIGERGAKSRPWALYVNFQRTHFPYDPAPGFKGRFEPSTVEGAFNYFYYPKAELQRVINRYDNALEYVDAQVGRVLDALEQSGQLENTLVVLTSDHGEHFYERGYVTHGKSISEGETRVPLLLSWPAKLKAQERLEPASTLDILPTVASLIGAQPEEIWQGRSLMPEHLAGKTQPGVFIRLQGIKHYDGVVCWPWKLSYSRADRSYELYQLSVDPDEKRNRVGQHEVLAGVLAKLLFTQVTAQLNYYRSTQRSESHDPQPQGPPRLMHCPSSEELERLESLGNL